MSPTQADAKTIVHAATRNVGVGFVQANETYLERAILLGLELPASDHETGVEVLRRIYAGSIQCWPIWGVEAMDEEPILIGALTTTIQKDWLYRTRDLLVYSFFMERHVEDDTLLEGFKAIEDYARSEKCGGLVLYTRQQRVEEIAALIGFSIDQKRMRKEV